MNSKTLNSMKYFLLIIFSMFSIHCIAQDWPSEEFI
ncbi:MAG: hypothetical protein ACI9L6_001269, partial [Flavobacterium sp.]